MVNWSEDAGMGDEGEDAAAARTVEAADGDTVEVRELHPDETASTGGTGGTACTGDDSWAVLSIPDSPSAHMQCPKQGLSGHSLAAEKVDHKLTA